MLAWRCSIYGYLHYFNVYFRYTKFRYLSRGSTPLFHHAKEPHMRLGYSDLAWRLNANDIIRSHEKQSSPVTNQHVRQIDSALASVYLKKRSDWLNQVFDRSWSNHGRVFSGSVFFLSRRLPRTASQIILNNKQSEDQGRDTLRPFNMSVLLLSPMADFCSMYQR